MKILKKATALLCSFAVLLAFFSMSCIKPAEAASVESVAASTQSVTLRVEGQHSTIYSGRVNFKQGESLYNIMNAAFAQNGVNFVANNGPYGHEIVSIGGESGTYPVWWHIYQNGKAAEVGADSLIPKSGDDIVLYLGDDSVVLYPTVTLTPQYPVAGKKVTVNVSATYTDYSDYTNPVTKTEAISGATVTFNGESFTTDKNGNAVITMPSAGSYTMRAVKENKNTTYAIVRTGDIAVTVYTADSVPSGTNSDSSAPGNSGTAGDAAKKTAVSSAAIKDAINQGSKYILKSGITDWSAAFAYASAGGKVPESYFDSVAEDLEMGGASLPIHLAGVIIGLKAAGADPRNFNGTDLVAQLYNSKKIGKSGLNGYTYSLLAFDCGNYSIPKNASVSREKLIDSILSYQKANGAFSLDKTSAADCDMTAIALTTLSPYIKENKVKTAVDAAVGYLSKTQQADGGYLPSYASNEVSESTAQVVIALTSAGIDPLNDTRFIKNGNSPISALMAYKNPDGGFAHIKGGKSDVMATDQAVMALTAYERYVTSARTIYDLTGIESAPVKVKVENPRTGVDGTEGAFAIVSMAALAAILLKKRGALTK